MAHEPPFGLDPHVAFRDLESLPVLMRRGMYGVITQRGANDPTREEFVSAFNIIAWSLTMAGRKRNPRTGGMSRDKGDARIKKGTIKLTGPGMKLEEEKRKLSDTDMKLKKLSGWADQLKRADPDLATMSWKEHRRRGQRSTT